MSKLVQLIREALPLLQERFKAGEDALDAIGNVSNSVNEIKEDVAELSNSMDVVLPAIVSLLRFTTESMRIILIGIPWDNFQPEWEYIPGRRYENGEVARMGENKWLSMFDNNELDQGQTPETSPRFTLHRDTKSFNEDGTKRKWYREEMCLYGTWRWDEESNNTEQHGWYRVKTRLVASAIPPYNDDANWEFMGDENPPDA